MVLHGHENLLKALGACRCEANAARRLHRPRSGMVRCLDSLMDEIDAVAELITGNATYFHDKGSSARSRPDRDAP